MKKKGPISQIKGEVTINVQRTCVCFPFSSWKSRSGLVIGISSRHELVIA